MTSTTRFGMFTAIIDHDEKTITVRARKAELNELVFTNNSGARNKAYKQMGIKFLIKQGYELIED